MGIYRERAEKLASNIIKEYYDYCTSTTKYDDGSRSAEKVNELWQKVVDKVELELAELLITEANKSQPYGE